MLALSALLLIPVCSHSEPVVISDDDFEVRVLSSDNSETLLLYRLGRFERTPVNIRGETYYEIHLENEPVTFEKGAPALPAVTRSIIIPDDARMEVQVVESRSVEYDMPVAPSKGLIPRGQSPDDVDYEFSTAYDVEGFYPKDVARLGSPYILRDFRGITVTVVPFAYNPETQTLRVFTHLVLKVRNTGTDVRNVKTRTSNTCNHAFNDIYNGHFLNFSTDRYEALDERGRMVVICHGDFLGAIQPWVDWKNQKGIQADLYDVATVGSTADDVKDFIQDQYDAGDGLTFVQLVGDAQQIPTFITDAIFFGIQGSSDATYSLLEGDDSYPDIFVGRFSAQNVAQVETQVDRTVRYERDISSGDWLHRGAGLGTVWGEGHGYNGWNGVQSLEVIRLDLLGYTYSEVAQLYEEGVPPFWIVPVEAWEVTEVLHDGIGILNVDGNADTTYLDTGSYAIHHVNALENDDELPFIFLAAPYAGRFHGTCFAEAWLWATNGATGAPTGAVAVYCCSNALAYAPPQAAMHEMVDLLVGEEMSSIGGLMYNGACWMMDVYGAPDEYDTFRNFNILGDASLQARTDSPQLMEISHDPSILVGQTEFLVSTGVEDALVCLSEDYVIIAADYADASGEVILTFDPFVEPTELRLTVTAYNRITTIATVPVRSSTAVTQDTSLRVTALTGNYPNPFNPRTTIRYSLSEEARVVLEVYNIQGQKIRTLVDASQRAGAHAATWDGRDEAGRSVSSGLYFCRLRAAGHTSTSRMIMLR